MSFSDIQDRYERTIDPAGEGKFDNDQEYDDLVSEFDIYLSKDYDLDGFIETGEVWVDRYFDGTIQKSDLGRLASV